jgi:acetyl esterase/lipase
MFPRSTIGLAFALLAATTRLTAGEPAPPVVLAKIDPTFRDVEFLAADRTEKMDVYLPADGKELRPAVVVIHGGGWSGGKKIWGYPVEFAKRAVPAGYAVFCPDYQLNVFEEVEGKKVSKLKGAPRNIQDCMDAVSFVRLNAAKYGVDPDRIALAGDSAGGHLAMLTAYGAGSDSLGQGRRYPEIKPTVRCIVDFYGISDLETFPSWGAWTFVRNEKDPEEVKKPLLQLYSPVTYIGAGSPPTLIVHGKNDPGVTWKQSEELAARLTAASVPFEFITLERATKHAFNFDSDEVDLTRRTLDFLDRYLKEGGKPSAPGPAEKGGSTSAGGGSAP